MASYSRRTLLKVAPAVPWLWGCARPERPNILFAIADDWSWPFASIYGDRVCRTPAFDRVAREGVLFNNAFVSSPSCTPSRGSILTGRPFWQLEAGANLFGPLPARFDTYPDRLERSDYFVGYTGKGWSPGDWKAGDRSRNPAGNEFNRIQLSPPTSGVNRTDYAANFQDFLKQRPAGKPFCFWYGSFEPHRVYERGSGLKAGKRLSDTRVPACLPDTEKVRSDLLDFALEVEWSDRHLGMMLELLEKAGELDNTLVVVTGDNGLPFPRCKTSLYDTGTRVPLAMRWPAGFKGGRDSDNFVSLPDLAPTFLEAAGLNPPPEMPARSLLGMLRSRRNQVDDPTRQFVITGRERHVAAQTRDSAGYPMRALRTRDYLFIRNYKPDRYPSGTPDGGQLGPYGDIDGSPTKELYLRRRNDAAIRRYFDLATALRPPVEIYDLRSDPDQMVNCAGRGGYDSAAAELSARLDQELKRLEDPRALGHGDQFDAYPPPNLEVYQGTR